MDSHDFHNRPLFFSLMGNPHSPPPSKPTLHPSCAVFPDSLPTTLSPPPLQFPNEPGDVSAPQSPVDPPDLYDYFQWSAVPTPTIDVSTPAPVGALGDDHSGDRNTAPLGAWYAFARGLHTPVGTALFPDQHPPPNRRPRLPHRPSSSHNHRNPPCSHPCTQCHKSDSSRPSSPLQSPSNSSCLHNSPSSSPSQSDSEDMRDNHGWYRHIIPCYVDSLRPPRLLSHTDPSAQVTTDEITVDQVVNGADVQGIPWDTLPFSRADYRATRMSDQIRNRDSHFNEGLEHVTNDPRRGAQFYDFFSNARAVKCSIVHFQLRNLAWATSMHDVYVMHDASIVHWDATSKRRTQVLDLSGSSPSTASGLGVVQISTMIAKDDLVIAGGFYGEMVAKNMRTGTIIHNKRITYDENAITNAIDIFDNTIMTSNNDCYVRCFDLQTFQRKSSFKFERAVNHATRQPEGKMVAMAGDDNAIQVIDGDSGERISLLRGHGHFSFATGWHPNGRMFATGSQDRTCRIWDIRNMSQSVKVLGAQMGAIRSLRFSSCGRFMVMAEPSDFVHIFEVNGVGFDTCQEIDLFGEIAGIALTPDAEGLYVAVSDRLYSSLIEYERRGSSKLSNTIYD